MSKSTELVEDYKKYLMPTYAPALVLAKAKGSRVYTPENTQYYVIDGFILSPNIMLRNVETLDCGFENSDHNPVEISVTLC